MQARYEVTEVIKGNSFAKHIEYAVRDVPRNKVLRTFKYFDEAYEYAQQVATQHN